MPLSFQLLATSGRARRGRLATPHGAIETALGRAAILRAALNQPLTQRAIGFGVGEIFGDRRWDGPFLGPVLDGSWINAINPEELWTAL